MRGKAAPADPHRPRCGITPAHAGKRITHLVNSLIGWDHPRVCGEKKIAGKTHALASGSPPRMRGKAQIPLPICPATGITPAYAGKRPGWADSGCQRGDHPCVCGEKRFASASLDAYWGSPPRMRGKDALPRPLPQKQGITPAYAGKSFTLSKFYRAIRDHPRVCGEKNGHR